MTSPESRNIIWAGTIASELTHHNIAGVCISPGSRSTPLALAMSAQSELRHYAVLDERSAAYFGIGLALAANRPAVLICTSGTAAANFFPAIVEANMAQVPLIVISADRPAALRDSGANQTVDQIKLYGNHVRWFVDVPPPDPSVAERSIRSLQTLVALAVAKALGPTPGPVHINLQFDKPLEPRSTDYLSQDDGAEVGSPGEWRTQEACLSVLSGIPTLSEEVVEELSGVLQTKTRGVIICGPRCQGGAFPGAVMALARALGYPILADALSGVRFSPEIDEEGGLVLGHYEAYVSNSQAAQELAPELVLQFGGALVSKSTLEYLGFAENALRIHVSGTQTWADENWMVNRMLVADPADLCGALTRSLVHMERVTDLAWAGLWKECEAIASEEIEAAVRSSSFEGGWVARLLEGLPQGCAIFVGNSLPVRHMDVYARPNTFDWMVRCNRGASGIDGTLSTAIGLAAGSRRPTAVLIGDLALLHDLNALMLIRKFALPVKVIVLNNDGGGLFYRLPIAKFDPPFTEIFRMPHGIGFEQAAGLFGLNYAYIGATENAAEVLTAALASPGAALIEIQSDAAMHEEIETQIRLRIAARIEGRNSIAATGVNAR